MAPAGVAAGSRGGGYESPSAQLRRWRASRPWRGALRPDSACPASDLPDPFLFPCDDHVPDDGLGVCVVSVRRRAVRAHLVCVPLCSRLQVSVGVLAARVCVRVCVCVSGRVALWTVGPLLKRAFRRCGRWTCAVGGRGAADQPHGCATARVGLLVSCSLIMFELRVCLRNPCRWLVCLVLVPVRSRSLLSGACGRVCVPCCSLCGARGGRGVLRRVRLPRCPLRGCRRLT